MSQKSIFSVVFIIAAFLFIAESAKLKLVYNEDTPMPMFTKEGPTPIDYVHKNIKRHSETKELINDGGTIEKGTILCVSYPILSHIKDGSPKNIRKIMDQINSIITEGKYKNILEFIELFTPPDEVQTSKWLYMMGGDITLLMKDERKKSIIKKFVKLAIPAKEEIDLFQFYPVTAMVAVDTNEFNVIGNIPSRKKINNVLVMEPLIIYASRDIERNEVIVASSHLERSDGIVTTDEIEVKIRLLTERTELNEGHINQIIKNRCNGKYYRVIESMVNRFGLKSVEPEIRDKMIWIMNRLQVNLEYFEHISRSHYIKLVHYGMEVVSREDRDIKYAVPYFEIASLDRERKQTIHWKEAINYLWKNGKSKDVLVIVRHAHQCCKKELDTNYDTNDLDMTYILGSIYLKTNDDELFKDDYMDLLEKGQYGLFIGIVQQYIADQERDEFAESDNLLQCIMLSLRLEDNDDRHYAQYSMFFGLFVWRYDWNDEGFREKIRDYWVNISQDNKDSVYAGLMVNGEKILDTKEDKYLHHYIVGCLLDNLKDPRDVPKDGLKHVIDIKTLFQHDVDTIHLLTLIIALYEGKDTAKYIYYLDVYLRYCILHKKDNLQEFNSRLIARFMSVIELNADIELFDGLYDAVNKEYLVRKIEEYQEVHQSSHMQVACAVLVLYIKIPETFQKINMKRAVYLVYFDIGIEYNKYGYYDDALQYMRLSIQQKRDNCDVYIPYFTCLRNKKMYKEIIQLYWDEIETLFKEKCSTEQTADLMHFVGSVMHMAATALNEEASELFEKS